MRKSINKFSKVIDPLPKPVMCRHSHAPATMKNIEQIQFNINDHVRVKLTDLGRQILIKNHIELFGSQDKYKAPEEDAEGWSRWQLWELMQELGNSCYNGCNVPFETTIILEKE